MVNYFDLPKCMKAVPSTQASQRPPDPNVSKAVTSKQKYLQLLHY